MLRQGRNLDLSKNEAFGNCRTYSGKFFVKGTFEIYRIKNKEVTILKVITIWYFFACSLVLEKRLGQEVLYRGMTVS